MTLILDAGGLLLLEANDRTAIASVKRAHLEGNPPCTHGGIIGQVWRGGHRKQANLARLLPSVRVEPLDDALGRQAGVLLGESGASDVLDAAIVLLATDGDEIWTSDPEDLAYLAGVAGLHVEIVGL